MTTDRLSYTEPRPFQIDVQQVELDEMRHRIEQTRWPEDFSNDAWHYGVEKTWLQDMVRYWSREFDWREQERAMNSLPHYMVEIDGVPIHFVHVKGKGPNPTPIILSHGWPWTFWDWRKVIGPLTDPAAHGGDPADSFDVVVPSMPGFAFSVPLTQAGVAPRRIAALWDTLMHDVLGYERYAAGGGDWGSTTTGEIGHGYPDHVLGIWLTLPHVPGVNIRTLGREDFAADEQWMWDQMEAAKPTIQSHFTVQRVEPQTIAYALADSPVGTAAWIWGRRRDWGDHDGDVLQLFDRDFLCTTASLYWLNGSIATSARIYAEHYGTGAPPAALHDRERVIDVPTAFGVFRKELLLMPRSVAERVTNLRRWSVFPRGGHYAPAEQPEIVVSELREFFRSLRDARSQV